jgi:hypothetical protein
MTDVFAPRPAPPQAPRSPRLALWTELEALHEQLGLAPPTATLTVEELEEAVRDLRAQVQQ